MIQKSAGCGGSFCFPENRSAEPAHFRIQSPLRMTPLRKNQGRSRMPVLARGNRTLSVVRSAFSRVAMRMGRSPNSAST